MDNKFVLSQSFNDIVFEKRNKKYGAYEIRRKYARYALLAGAAAILFFTCGTFTWAYVQKPEAPRKYLVMTVDASNIQNIKERDEKLPEQPKEEQRTEAAAQQKGVNVQEVTTEIKIVEEAPDVPPADLGLVRGDSSATVTIPGGGTGDCIGCPPKQDSVPPMRIIEWSNNPPTCEGLDTYLTKNIRYPEMCREQGIEGTVYVQFIVDTKGSYRDVQVVKGPHPALNKEALRVMSGMPQWTPAKDDNGVPVDFLMRKPIKFQLSH